MSLTPDPSPFSTRRAAARVVLASAVIYLMSAPLGILRGQEAPAAAASPVERQVLQASNDWFTALMVGDLDALDRLQTDDFLTVQRGPGGVAVVGKKQQMENMRKSGEDRPRFERSLTAVKVREYGSVAVLTGLATFRQPGPRQRAVVSQAVVTEIWINENGRWRLAHFQPTDVPVKAPPK